MYFQVRDEENHSCVTPKYRYHICAYYGIKVNITNRELWLLCLIGLIYRFIFQNYVR